MNPRAENARNFSQCDSLLIGDRCGAHTFPVIDVRNSGAVVEHEATTSKISDDQLFYCNQRGLDTEEAVGLIVNGYAREVLNKLPDGVRRGGAEAAFGEPGRKCGIEICGAVQRKGPVRRHGKRGGTIPAAFD